MPSFEISLMDSAKRTSFVSKCNTRIRKPKSAERPNTKIKFYSSSRFAKLCSLSETNRPSTVGKIVGCYMRESFELMVLYLFSRQNKSVYVGKNYIFHCSLELRWWHRCRGPIGIDSGINLNINRYHVPYLWYYKMVYIVLGRRNGRFRLTVEIMPLNWT